MKRHLCTMQKKKTILVAPLNWGLGHATRSIPVIHALMADGFNVLIGSDGAALNLLKQEFPTADFLELPSYQIEYSKNGKKFMWKMILRSPKVAKAIHEENKLLKKMVRQGEVDGVVSDNRLGLYNKHIPTVFITHQLQVLSGNTTKLTSALHYRYIKKFDECWVPDYQGKPNLSGKLGHPKSFNIPVKYLGPLSRLNKKECDKEYDVLVLLSGPEPQRSELEEILFYEFKKFKGNVLFVKGVVEDEQKVERIKEMKVVNFMESTELEKAINSSDIVVCRSGYTTVMDLVKLNKKAFFIPTPGQTEQEYLARRFKKKGWIPCANQENFKLKDLSSVEVYKGFRPLIDQVGFTQVTFGELFGLFKGERELRPHTKVAFYINLFIMGLNNVFDDREAKS